MPLFMVYFGVFNDIKVCFLVSDSGQVRTHRKVEEQFFVLPVIS